MLHDCLNDYLRSYFNNILNLEDIIKVKRKRGNKEREAIKRTQDILEKAETLYQENSELQDKLEELQEDWRQKEFELKRAIVELESENKQYLDKLLKNSKELVTGNPKRKSAKQKWKKKNSGNKQFFSSNSAEYKYVQKQTPKKPKRNKKFLALKQLKDTMKEVYEAKKIYDQKCLKSNLPIETLEHYLYTFLTTKFGLKSLVIEWAESILTAVEKYSEQDYEVVMFGKILQNRIDEDFRLVQNEIEKTINSILLVKIREKYPLKTEAFLKKEVKRIIKSKVGLKEADAILNSVLSKEDVERVGKFIEDQNEIKSHKVPFSTLKRSIMLFFLNKHQEYLKKIRDIFDSVDENDDGIITRAQLEEIIGYIDPINELNLRKKELKKLCDPRKLDNITFSQFISIMSSIRISYNGEEISLIQYSSIPK